MAQVKTSKGLRAAYWSLTVLLCALLGFAAFNHITGSPEITAQTIHLGFPLRLMPFLGILKILAVVTLLIGRRNDLTVGAYAGLVFYGLGAMATHLTIGDPVPKAVGGFLIIALSLGSYFLWKRTRGRSGQTATPSLNHLTQKSHHHETVSHTF